MNKKIIIVMLLITVLLLPTISAIELPNPKNNANGNNIISNTKGVPVWADGPLNGTWGLREYSILFGMIEIPIGNITGHYKNFIGPIKYFKGSFYPYSNHSKITNISGVFFGSVVFGKIGDVDVDQEGYNFESNETNYVGIGSFNETNYDWRIISRTGPAFYIKGDLSIFK